MFAVHNPLASHSIMSKIERFWRKLALPGTRFKPVRACTLRAMNREEQRRQCQKGHVRLGRSDNLGWKQGGCDQVSWSAGRRDGSTAGTIQSSAGTPIIASATNMITTLIIMITLNSLMEGPVSVYTRRDHASPGVSLVLACSKSRVLAHLDLDRLRLRLFALRQLEVQ